MVKIDNTLGDFKRGRQGEAVYQGRYGQQIRRTVQPKRAIPSQKQLDHRLLYRLALAWRKALPLANRRYLDGYCIANWIVDDYKIPLAWHRFALKLYLQHVNFTYSDRGVEYEEYDPTQRQHYTTGDDSSIFIEGRWWRGMTFTPETSHFITKVRVKCWREENTEIMECSIRNTSGSKPIAPDLTYGSINTEDYPTSPPGAFLDIPLSPYIWLTKDVKYALVVRARNAPNGYRPHWQKDTTGSYTRGGYVNSEDQGVTWSEESPDIDYMFEEWGRPPPKEIKTATLHVQHPALHTVAHYRNGALYAELTDLSSLDDEYLTKQVGIDVIAEDIIEAITITGRQYSQQFR